MPWAQVCVVVFMLVLVGAIFWPVFKKNQDHMGRSILIQREIEEQRAYGLQLQEELYALQDDPYYIERVARDVLNLGKEGEVIFRFPAYEENKRSGSAAAGLKK
ncbi:MAG: septum formation initiator family protein [Blastochloris sp.]|nr:septum formation initiator family protein [Blastochloris sp.]